MPSDSLKDEIQILNEYKNVVERTARKQGELDQSHARLYTAGKETLPQEQWSELVEFANDEYNIDINRIARDGEDTERGPFGGYRGRLMVFVGGIFAVAFGIYILSEYPPYSIVMLAYGTVSICLGVGTELWWRFNQQEEDVENI